MNEIPEHEMTREELLVARHRVSKQLDALQYVSLAAIGGDSSEDALITQLEEILREINKQLASDKTGEAGDASTSE